MNNKIDNKYLIDLYWKIGKIIYISKLSYNEIIKLERYLQAKYGIVIGFTRRNFLNMKKFYKTYFNNERVYKMLQKVSWYKHLWIMNNGRDEKEYLLDVCSNYNVPVSDLRKLIKNKDLSGYKKINKFDNNSDEMVKELVNLQNRMQKV